MKGAAARQRLSLAWRQTSYQTRKRDFIARLDEDEAALFSAKATSRIELKAIHLLTIDHEARRSARHSRAVHPLLARRV